jgi:hypothetical protein
LFGIDFDNQSIGTANWLFYKKYVAELTEREPPLWMWWAGNTVQLGIDFVFDLFVLIAFILFGIAMLRHPGFGWPFGLPGIIFSGLTLGFDAYTFPIPAPEAFGWTFEPAHLVGLWLLTVAIQMLRLGGERGWQRVS